MTVAMLLLVNLTSVFAVLVKCLGTYELTLRAFALLQLRAKSHPSESL